VLQEKIDPIHIKLPEFVRLHDSNRGLEVPRQVGELFGVPLITIYSKSGNKLPPIIDSSISFIERHGLKTEGIYRIPGDNDLIKFCKSEWDSGKDPLIDFTDGDNHDMLHATCSVLKMFIREQPLPLIPYEYYDEIITNANNEEKLRGSLELIFDVIPSCHKLFLHKLLRHWSNVVLNSAENKMGSSNIAVVFAPNVIKSPPSLDATACLVHTPAAIKALTYLIENEASFVDRSKDESLKRDSASPTGIRPSRQHISNTKTKASSPRHASKDLATPFEAATGSKEKGSVPLDVIDDGVGQARV
jgi:hypothetical protein